MLSLLAIICLTYGGLELYLYKHAPINSDREKLALSSLEQSVSSFNTFTLNFSGRSLQLAEDLKLYLKSSSSPDGFFKKLSNYPGFWGVVVFRKGESWFWNGFAPAEYPKDLLDINSSYYVSIKKENNITYLFALIPFFVAENGEIVRYDVLTLTKIAQNNILPIGEEQELDASTLFTNENSYPVHFSFFEPIPEQALSQAKLSTVSSDSVGVAYTLDTDFGLFLSRYKNRELLLQFIFLLTFLITVYALVHVFTTNIKILPKLLVRTGSIIFAWIIISEMDSALITVPFFRSIYADGLGQYILNALLLFLITYLIIISSASKSLSLRFSSTLGAFILSFFSGFLSFLCFQSFFHQTIILISKTSLQLMDFELIPSLNTALFYISTSLFIGSVLYLTRFVFYQLLRHEKNRQFFLFIITFAGYISAYMFFRAAGSQLVQTNWILAASLLLFVVTFVVAYFNYHKPRLFWISSKLRTILFFCALTSVIVYLPLFKGEMLRKQANMLEAATNFITDEEDDIQNIIYSLLVDLETSLRGITENDIKSRQPFVESFFDMQASRLIQEDWARFTISTQFVDNNGNTLSEYTTSISPPDWSKNFNIYDLKIPLETEQIRRKNLRPIIRNRPLSSPPNNYSSFRRGWIPVYKSDPGTNILGWILCSVYKERTQFDKPLRAVLASHENDRWNDTYSIAEYEKQLLTRATTLGTPLEIPGYSHLSEDIVNEVIQDSIIKRQVNLRNEDISEWYFYTGNNKIIRVATKLPSFESHIFTFLRLFFTLIVFCFTVILLYSFFTSTKLIDTNNRFRDRLLDRFIIASLASLVALIFISYFAIKQQNKRDVEDQIVEKLDNFVASLNLNETRKSSTNSLGIQNLTSVLNVDVLLYSGQSIASSTTPQLFSQHIIPNNVPWDVFRNIINGKSGQEIRSTSLGNQPFLIGYQPWFNSDNSIAGIVAIPTFLHAPKFYDRLLTTTSYLIVFYVVIFGILMITVALITNQLITPLEELREGIKRISSGEVDVTLPVKSNDEIGMLTAAYNSMSHRLKVLQEELASAEREAAWKEMAQQVAHEIKNPLTPMKLNLQLLERQMEQTGISLSDVKPKISRITKNMIEQIESLSIIASDFSKFAQPINQDFSRINLNDLVQSTIEFYSAEQAISIQAHLSSEEIIINGAKEDIRRVLINLLKNALEALSESGEIVIETSVNHKKNSAFITVRDNGQGIPPEDFNRIFVPNFSTKSSGTGLGLAITKKIIEEHEGEISFDSEIGIGTTFTIQLPLAKN